MTTNAKTRYRSWFINLLLILAVFIGIQWWKARPLATGPAPALAGHLLDGRPFDLRALRESGGGRPVLVHFWATWCPVCRLGQDGIDAIARDHALVSVALQSGDERDIQDFMGKEGLGFPVLPDPYGEAASAWGVAGVPASFVVDAAGQIRFATVGYTTEAGLRARLWAAEALD
jgi:thiol-disulfide isomerase/thioredoxin